jgi:hypothetical protein
VFLRGNRGHKCSYKGLKTDNIDKHNYSWRFRRVNCCIIQFNKLMGKSFSGKKAMANKMAIRWGISK